MSIRMLDSNGPVPKQMGHVFRLLEAKKLTAPFILTSSEGIGIFFVTSIDKNLDGKTYTAQYVRLDDDHHCIAVSSSYGLSIHETAMWKLYTKPITIENNQI